MEQRNHSTPVMKLPIFGEPGVGKSSLAKRLCRGKFTESYDSTTGSNFFTRSFQLYDKNIDVTIFDLAGQKRFVKLDPLYWQGASCSLAIFDLTRRETFQRLKQWLKRFRKENPKTPILIAGNKKDLDKHRKVSKQEGKTLARKNNAEYMEVSAKTGKGVEIIFKKAVKMGVTKKMVAQ